MYNKSIVMPKAFSNMMEDLFGNGFHKMFQDEPLPGTTHVPVNITETETAYQLELVAPGLKKESFKVSVDHNLLSISFDHQETEMEENNKFIRREFRLKSFKRNFNLNERIDASGISAQYLDGILYLSLPKKVQESTSQEINVG
ncbi:MAG: Hsp20/alpha crystallin family protein [Bacteroidetes bacterium]|nr:Hsp20/alpha crystallin family protein [Bacteroidota bacterium]